jgi:hypothetical protein
MSSNMTREGHIKWCKERAISEYDYYRGESEKTRNGLTSMMSDLSKHPETNSDALRALCLMNMGRAMNRQQFINFINGFN